MAKNKKNNRKNAEAFNSKKASTKPKALNPFEMHLNKEKFKILGRKNKHDRGLPGVSRAKAQNKRKATLGREYLEKHKTNTFKDNRIGRRAPDEVDETQAMARFAAEKLTQYKEKRKNMYNLNEDEVLTHRGQTLEEIEQFRKPDSDVSDDEALDADFTEAAHFGGGDDKLDRKAAIEEMIIETKRKKAEAAKDKDEVYQLTSQLDSNYKELIPMMGKLSKRETRPKAPQDDYDRILREMVFQPRGEVTDKLATDEEIKRKEKERLEKLEHERLARMRGEDPDAPAKPTHRSADALDDGYFAETDNEEEEGTLAYDLNGVNTPDDGNDEALGDDSLENNEDDHELENVVSDDDDGESQEEGSDEEEGEEEEESDEDSLDDLKASDTESEEDADEEEELPKNKKEKKKPLKRKGSEADDKASAAIKRQKAEKQLPFTFDMPESYEALTELLEKHSPPDQGQIVDRLIKCHHPKLDPANKEKMIKLFTYLLQYLNDLFADVREDSIAESFRKFDKIAPHFYDLIHMNGDRTAACILEVIKEKYEEYKKNPKEFPPLETVIFFKLVSNAFSTSDFRHPVVTPCCLFIAHILSRARPRNRRELATGLLLVTIIMEYTSLSKRFLPAAVNFLLGVIFLTIYKRPIEIVRAIPPFQSRGAQNSLLALNEKFDGPLDESKLQAVDLATTTIDDSFKVRAFNSALEMLVDFIANTEDNVGLRFILDPFADLLDRVGLELYPDFVRESYEKAKNAIESVNTKSLLRLVEIEKKPKPLRLMEPKIVPVYDDKRRPKMSAEKEMRAILTHKLKRETKGAVREIRRDNEFISKMRLKQQIQSDTERKEKVRRIYSEASIQQGELNALERSKKKK